jgi:hypothetical protein
MNISASVDGNNVRIVDIDVNGSSAYLTFIDANGNLMVVRKGVTGAPFTSAYSADSLLATGASGS